VCAGWEVEAFIDRLTRRDDKSSEGLVLEAISHLRAFSRDSDALREDNRALRAERDALREALTWALDRLNNARNVCYGGVTL
jgi:hypothetical protein